MQYTAKQESQSPNILRIFLCHSSGDKPAVRALYDRLKGDGFEIWFDEQRLLPAQDWDYEIRKAVANSDIVIVCLSRASKTKAGYLQKELSFALDIASQQPEGSIFIIPVKLEECDAPERLNKWQWVNLFAKEGYKQLIDSLSLRASQTGLQINNGNEESTFCWSDWVQPIKPNRDENKENIVQQKKYSPFLVESWSKRRAMAGGVVCGIALIIVMLLILIKFHYPTSFQYTVLTIILAIILAGITLTASLLIDVRVSALLRVGATVAVFIGTYFFSPVKLITVIRPTAEIETIMPRADGSLSVHFTNGIEIELVSIPPGSFEMGSTKEEVERPRVSKAVKP